MPTVLHVSPAGSDTAAGTASAPLRTINAAAAVAMPGDTVLVHAGEYREWVKPPRGGLDDLRRITYAAAPGERVVIKGSERITNWQPEQGTVWRADVPNSLFGDFNPYREELGGDWFLSPAAGAPPKHLGEVYLNGRSGYEADTAADLTNPEVRTSVVDDWTGLAVDVLDPDQTRYLWHAEVGPDHTTIRANFHGADPNRELVEINVRRSVFTPVEHHLDYLTVRGFELAHAACPWTPPTADQPGLIGPNWAKGWIIEENDIHDAKCSAVSLGKDAATGHNFATDRGDKPGYQYQLESVFAAGQLGWDAEHIGSHVIRRNTIHDCGQNGIVGHLGGVFSTIEDNHIYNIAIKREFYGYEIAGIKLHAAIDVRVEHNRIHDCTLGAWFDWQTQGTRITRNVCYRNRRDLFVEVSHGPYLVDHNLLASPASLEIFSQGGAFVHNLIGGALVREPVLDRPTPYHRPHSTQVAGYAAIIGGDDRWIGNIFVGGDASRAYGVGGQPLPAATYGTASYDGHPASFADYLVLVGDPSRGDHQRFADVPQPVYLRRNAYLDGAAAYSLEADAARLETTGALRVVEDGPAVYLEIALPEGFDTLDVGVVSGRDLAPVRLVGLSFEERDGRPARIDLDLLGVVRGARMVNRPGPIAALCSASASYRVW